MLTEVVQVDPFASEDQDAAWEAMAEHLNQTFRSDDPTLEAELSSRTLKDKVERMLKQFQESENSKLRKYVTSTHLLKL